MTDRLPIAPVGLWISELDYLPTTRSREVASELEELGYGAIWLPEVAGRDVFVHLALLLASTKRMVGASGIANIWARDAISMAASVRGLTEAFPDRLVTGLGVSHRSLVADLRGHAYEKPLAAMRAYLEAMDAAPFTATRPTTPVRLVLAALGPKMLQLAAEKTQGVLTYLVPPEHTHEARTILGPSAGLCVEQAVLAEEDPARARRIAREHTSIYIELPNYQNNLRRLGFSDDDFVNGGSDRLVDALVAWGSDETLRGRVKAHFDGGADHVCVQVLSEGRRNVPLDQWHRLAPALTDLGPREAAVAAPGGERP